MEKVADDDTTVKYGNGNILYYVIMVFLLFPHNIKSWCNGGKIVSTNQK
jgi:hypothetical protein